MVNLTLRVLSKPDVDRLPRIFTTLGVDYDERVLPSIGNEVLKAVVVGPLFCHNLLPQSPVRGSLFIRADRDVKRCGLRFGQALWVFKNGCF